MTEKELEAKIELLQKSLEELRKMTSSEMKIDADKKSKVGVTGYGENIKYSSSPAASGRPRNYKLGTTGSGKPINSIHGNIGAEYHKEFTPEEHKDAYFAHGNQAKSFDPQKTNPALIQHHKDMAQHHWDKYIAGISKK